MKTVWMLKVCGEFDFFTSKKKAMDAMDIQLDGYPPFTTDEGKWLVSYTNNETGDEIASVSQWDVN